jgi:hypothetical protein
MSKVKILLKTINNIEQLEMGVHFHGGPVLGDMAECSFPRAFQKSVKFLFIRTLMRNSRHVKEISVKGQLSP